VVIEIKNEERSSRAHPYPELLPIKIRRLGHGVVLGSLACSLGFKTPTPGIPINGDTVGLAQNGNPYTRGRNEGATAGSSGDANLCPKARPNAWPNSHDDDGEENVDAIGIGASSSAGGGTSRLGPGPSFEPALGGRHSIYSPSCWSGNCRKSKANVFNAEQQAFLAKRMSTPRFSRVLIHIWIMGSPLLTNEIPWILASPPTTSSVKQVKNNNGVSAAKANGLELSTLGGGVNEVLQVGHDYAFAIQGIGVEYGRLEVLRSPGGGVLSEGAMLLDDAKRAGDKAVCCGAVCASFWARCGFSGDVLTKRERRPRRGILSQGPPLAGTLR